MKRFGIILLLFLISLPLLIPFLRSGYFTTHDGEWAVIRLVEMHREIKDLQIPPRWAGFLNHGYGYPLFLFTYPLPYYLGEFFHLVGFGFVNSIKLVFGFSIVASAFFMFLLARRWWGVVGGLIAVFFYLYAPFRLVDLYIRGSIGESLAFVFFPLLFLLGEQVVLKKKRLDIMLFALAFGAFIITHNVFALLFAPVLSIYLIFFLLDQKKYMKQSAIALGLSVLSGLGISSYFWLPALLEQKYTALAQGILDRPEQFVSVWKLFSVFPSNEELPIFIGMVHILGFLVGLGILIKSGKYRKLLILGGLVMIMIILMLPISGVFWDYAPMYSSIDFSWRMLGPLIFILSLGIGVIGKIKARFVIIPLFFGFLLFTNRSLLSPNDFFNKDDQFYETNDATTTAFDELMPMWVIEKPGNWPEEKVFISKNSGMITIIEDKSQRLAFRAEMEGDGKLEVNMLYFPGWKAIVDEKKEEIQIHKKRGTMLITLPSGTHDVMFSFGNTTARNIADAISLISGLVVISLLLPVWKHKKFSLEEKEK